MDDALLTLLICAAEDAKPHPLSVQEMTIGVCTEAAPPVPTVTKKYIDELLVTSPNLVVSQELTKTGRKRRMIPIRTLDAQVSSVHSADW